MLTEYTTPGGRNSWADCPASLPTVPTPSNPWPVPPADLIGNPSRTSMFLPSNIPFHRPLMKPPSMPCCRSWRWRPKVDEGTTLSQSPCPLHSDPTRWRLAWRVERHHRGHHLQHRPPHRPTLWDLSPRVVSSAIPELAVSLWRGNASYCMDSSMPATRT